MICLTKFILIGSLVSLGLLAAHCQDFLALFYQGLVFLDVSEENTPQRAERKAILPDVPAGHIRRSRLRKCASITRRRRPGRILHQRVAKRARDADCNKQAPSREYVGKSSFCQHTRVSPTLHVSARRFH